MCMHRCVRNSCDLGSHALLGVVPEPPAVPIHLSLCCGHTGHDISLTASRGFFYSQKTSLGRVLGLNMQHSLGRESPSSPGQAPAASTAGAMPFPGCFHLFFVHAEELYITPGSWIPGPQPHAGPSLPWVQPHCRPSLPETHRF